MSRCGTGASGGQAATCRGWLGSTLAGCVEHALQHRINKALTIDGVLTDDLPYPPGDGLVHNTDCADGRSGLPRHLACQLLQSPRLRRLRGFYGIAPGPISEAEGHADRQNGRRSDQLAPDHQ